MCFGTTLALSLSGGLAGTGKIEMPCSCAQAASCLMMEHAKKCGEGVTHPGNTPNRACNGL